MSNEVSILKMIEKYELLVAEKSVPQQLTILLIFKEAKKDISRIVSAIKRKNANEKNRNLIFT